MALWREVYRCHCKAVDADNFEEACQKDRDDKVGDGDAGQSVVMRKQVMVPRSRGCLWLALFCLW